jgi:hypothetical protein
MAICRLGKCILPTTFVLLKSFSASKPPRRQHQTVTGNPMATVLTLNRLDMKQTFLDKITERLTARPTSQRNEVLFFANAHFLFFNFFSTAQNTLSFFCRHTNPTQKKMKECFFHRIFKYLFIILYSCASI